MRKTNSLKITTIKVLKVKSILISFSFGSVSMHKEISKHNLIIWCNFSADMRIRKSEEQ